MRVAFGPVAAAGSAVPTGTHIRGSDLPEVWAFRACGTRAGGSDYDHPVPVLRHLHVVDRPTVRYVDRALCSPVAPDLAGPRIQHAATAAGFVDDHIDSGSLDSAIGISHTKDRVVAAYTSLGSPRLRESCRKTIATVREIIDWLWGWRIGPVGKVVLADGGSIVRVKYVGVYAAPDTALRQLETVRRSKA